MQEQVITDTDGETLFVTVLRQFTLPTAIHVDTIRNAVRKQASYMTLDLYGFREQASVWDYATIRDAREHLVNRMVDWLKQYGVQVETDLEAND